MVKRPLTMVDVILIVIMTWISVDSNIKGRNKKIPNICNITDKIENVLKEVTSTALHVIVVLQDELCELFESYSMEQGSAYGSSRKIHCCIQRSPENI
jgi:hypothetical protein